MTAWCLNVLKAVEAELGITHSAAKGELSLSES